MKQTTTNSAWQNAYQVSESQARTVKAQYRKFWAVIAVLALPLAFALEIVKDTLLELNILHPQAGRNSLGEVLLNATLWNFVTYLLMYASVPVFFWGFIIIAKQSRK